jgi:hypothetical protein
MLIDLRPCLAFSSVLALGLVSSCAAEPTGFDVGEGELHAEVEAKREALVITSCLNEQQGRIREAVATANDAVIDSLDDLDSVLAGGDTTRVDYWFGTHDPTIVANIHDVYARMLPLLSSATYTCECDDPSPGHVARATKNDPSAPVQVCPAFFDWDFWEYSVGAIIHEASHWEGIEHTQEGCTNQGSDLWPEEYHEFAKYFPNLAATNAEHYRLYALDWHPGQHSTYLCGSEQTSM